MIYLHYKSTTGASEPQLSLRSKRLSANLKHSMKHRPGHSNSPLDASEQAMITPCWWEYVNKWPVPRIFLYGPRVAVDDKSQNGNRTRLFHTHMPFERPMRHSESFAMRSHTFPDTRTHLIDRKAQPSQREITTKAYQSAVLVVDYVSTSPIQTRE